MLAVAVPKRNKLQNIIVLTPKDGAAQMFICNFIICSPGIEINTFYKKTKNFTLISDLSHPEGIEEKPPECYTEYRIKCSVF